MPGILDSPGVYERRTAVAHYVTLQVPETDVEWGIAGASTIDRIYDGST
jgi:hypothetical protein